MLRERWNGAEPGPSLFLLVVYFAGNGMRECVPLIDETVPSRWDGYDKIQNREV